MVVNYTDNNSDRIENRDYLEQLASNPLLAGAERELLKTWLLMGFENGDQPTLKMVAHKRNISKAGASRLWSSIRTKLKLK